MWCSNIGSFCRRIWYHPATRDILHLGSLPPKLSGDCTDWCKKKLSPYLKFPPQFCLAKWPALAQPIGQDGICLTQLSSLSFSLPLYTAQQLKSEDSFGTRADLWTSASDCCRSTKSDRDSSGKSFLALDSFPRFSHSEPESGQQAARRQHKGRGWRLLWVRCVCAPSCQRHHLEAQRKWVSTAELSKPQMDSQQMISECNCRTTSCPTTCRRGWSSPTGRWCCSACAALTRARSPATRRMQRTRPPPTESSSK